MLTRTALQALIFSGLLTACADRIVQPETRAPLIDASLFELPERPRLGPGDASWIDLRVIAEELKGWGEQCKAQLYGVRDAWYAAKRRAGGEPGPAQKGF